MVIYRPQIGANFEKSMARAEEFSSEEEMIARITDQIESDYADLGVPKLMPLEVYVDKEKEAYDERNGWLHTRIVWAKGYPGVGSKPIMLGYTDVETFA